MKKTKYMILRAFFWVCLLLITNGGICYGDESGRALFLKKAFQNMVPSPDYIWITPTVRQQVESILNHEYKGLRIKYWQNADQTVWILNDMAKGKPVCAGIVVSQGKTEKVEILSAQGKWGALIKNENFVTQFEDAVFNEKQRLSKSIDGISGATISVKTVTNIVRLALALDEIVYRKTGKKKSPVP